MEEEGSLGSAAASPGSAKGALVTDSVFTFTERLQAVLKVKRQGGKGSHHRRQVASHRGHLQSRSVNLCEAEGFVGGQ